MQNCDNSTQSLHVSMHSSMEHGLTRTNQKCNKFFSSCHTMHETASLLEALRFKSIRPFSAFRCELLQNPFMNVAQQTIETLRPCWHTTTTLRANFQSPIVKYHLDVLDNCRSNIFSSWSAKRFPFYFASSR